MAASKAAKTSAKGKYLTIFTFKPDGTRDVPSEVIGSFVKTICKSFQPTKPFKAAVNF